MFIPKKVWMWACSNKNTWLIQKYALDENMFAGTPVIDLSKFYCITYGLLVGKMILTKTHMTFWEEI